jgi:hypothetical protein
MDLILWRNGAGLKLRLSEGRRHRFKMVCFPAVIQAAW